MKKILLISIALIYFGCTNESENLETQKTLNPQNNTQQLTCGTGLINKELLRKNPSIANKIRSNELQMQSLEEKLKASNPNQEYIIPVHINVLYKNVFQKIPGFKLRKMIDGLNRNFAQQNLRYHLITKPIFKKVSAGNTNIKFTFNPNTDLSYKEFNTSYSFNEGNNNPYDIAIKTTAGGGLDATGIGEKLNIWIVGDGLSVNGYAYYPDTVEPYRIGVVLASHLNYIDTNSGTLTHEVGHWLNLIHLWGDYDNILCGDDSVDDTPKQQGPSSFFSSCDGKFTLNNSANYMDYTPSIIKTMFTEGQEIRMKAALMGEDRKGFVTIK